MKAYITCPVSHSKNRLNLLPIIKKIVESKRIKTFVFKIGGIPKEIFKRDYSNLKESDIIIAEVSERSHGVGAEIGLSYCLGLKRILLIEKGNFISKLIQGIPNTKIIEYKNIEDLKIKLSEAIEELTL